MTAARAPVTADRRAMLAKVHLAKKDLALDEASYRGLLERVTKKASAAKCSQAQLHDVLAEFKRLGWKPKKKGPKRAGRRSLADRPEEAAKIRALWLDLWHLAQIRDPSEEALAAYCKRMTGGRERGVDAIQWLDGDQADRVIKGLRGWLERIGFVFPDAERRKLIAKWRERAGLTPAPAGFSDKVAILEAQWQRLKGSGTMRYAFFADLGSWCAKHHGAAAPWLLSAEQADAAIEDLGKWLRRAEGAGATAEARDGSRGGVRPKARPAADRGQDGGDGR